MRLSKAVVKNRVLILIVALLLLIPSVLGMANTRINYDMLDYLPEDMDTVIGQNELLDEFGKGAFSLIVVEDMPAKDVAALSSRSCAELYGLSCLASSVQDKGNNRTRFICISKNLEIYPGSDKTSVMMVLNHRPGALYKVLARIYALGINVTKLESRPIPDREFEFMFYFDLETSIYSEEFVQLMCELEDLCEEFKYLGSYTEVV